MKWHANAADLLARTGSGGAAAARLVLAALLPGAPGFAALLTECLDCAAGAGPFPDASAADLDRAAETLALLASDLLPLLTQAAELADLPDRATRLVFRALASDGRLRDAACRVGRLAGESDRLAAQVRRFLAGSGVEAVAAALRSAPACAGVADFVAGLCSDGAGPDEVRDRAEAFARALRLYGEGRFAEAGRAWAGQAAAGASAAAVVAAVNQDPGAAAGPGLPPGEWFVADSARPQAGFDRTDAPPTDPSPGQIFQLRASREATDDDLAGLARWPGASALYALVMTGCTRLTDAGLAHLEKLDGLRVLELSFCDHLTDAGLAHLAGLTGLFGLNLTRVGGVTDAGLAHLAGLSRLRSLDLTKCERLTDASLGLVAGLTELRSLDVSLCPLLTDAGMAHLANLPRLQALSLDGCPLFTDAGLAGLHGMTALRSLSLGCCEGISGEGIDSLRAALPECEIWG